MFIERHYLECPFCKKGIIEFLYKPSVYSAKRTSCRAGKSTTLRKTSEEIVIITQKCPVCGKTAEEIEKKWREEGVI